MMKKNACLIALACCFLAACKHDDDTADVTLHCPSDTMPVKGTLAGKKFLLPNAFSANGDGRNDLFRILTSDTTAIRSMEVKILDAAGRQVAALNSPHDSWDGYNRATGALCPEGKYQVVYGIVMNGGATPDVAIDGENCLTLLRSTGTGGCLKQQGGNPADYVFEDRVDPVTLEIPYTTGENICP